MAGERSLVEAGVAREGGRGGETGWVVEEVQ